jgi:hypothetical protein
MKSTGYKMKDITISGKRIKTEIIIWLCCLCAAVLINIFAISKYGNSWWELLTQLHIVLLISIVIYFITGIIRLAFYSIRRLSLNAKQ